jgi:ATP-dependent DNA helicase RecG
LYNVIISNPGIKAKDIPCHLSERPLKTIERQVKVLIDKNMIERRGSRNTGGYYVISQKKS